MLSASSESTFINYERETEYRLFTKVNNISPRDYLELQTNVELRATWDTWVQVKDRHPANIYRPKLIPTIFSLEMFPILWKIRDIKIVESLTPESAQWNGRDEGVVIRWVAKMPAFLSAREYIYFREVFHNKEDKLIVIVARECDHPQFEQVEKGLVRVENYRSVTVITYDDFEKPGFTSMLTYHDNVSKILPSGSITK